MVSFVNNKEGSNTLFKKEKNEGRIKYISDMTSLLELHTWLILGKLSMDTQNSIYMSREKNK